MKRLSRKSMSGAQSRSFILQSDCRLTGSVDFSRTPSPRTRGTVTCYSA